MNEVRPPKCFICKKDFGDKMGTLHYCICDIAVCSDCINSLIINNNEWKCPKCDNINNIEESKLFREKS